MEKHVEALLALAKRMELQERAYEEVILFEAKAESTFAGFLIHDRLKPFLMMLIFDHVAEKEFVIGHGETNYFEPVGEDEEGDVHKYGATLIAEKYDGAQVFQYLLARHDFKGVIPENPAVIAQQVRFGTDGHFTDHWYESLQQEVFIALDGSIIVSEAYVYVADAALKEKIVGLIAFHQPRFQEFLKMHEDTAIPHRLYLNWFMEWFPQQIHLGQLEE